VTNRLEVESRGFSRKVAKCIDCLHDKFDDKIRKDPSRWSIKLTRGGFDFIALYPGNSVIELK